MNEDVTTNDVLSALGVTTDNEDTSTDTDGNSTNDSGSTTTENNGANASASDQSTEESTESPEEIFQKGGKVNQAFAQMRTENKQYRTVIENLGKVLGINAKDPAEIMGAVETALTKEQAAKQNIPPEVLMKMNQLEQQNQMFTQAQLKQKALIGFNAVKEQFSLKDNDVNEFVKQLAEADINPFETEVDLITQYKIMNYDKLMEAAKQEAIKQEAERLAKVNNHSTSPGTQTGATNTGSTEKINTVSGLTAFLSGK